MRAVGNMAGGRRLSSGHQQQQENVRTLRQLGLKDGDALHVQGASGCLACAAGTFSVSGASSCDDCAAGSYSTSASPACTLCALPRLDSGPAAKRLRSDSTSAFSESIGGVASLLLLGCGTSLLLLGCEAMLALVPET